MVNFNSKQMEKLVEKDPYLTFVFKDMMSRREPGQKEEVLEVLFNSNVLEDSVYTRAYNSIK